MAACPHGTDVIRSQATCAQAVQYLNRVGTQTVGNDGSMKSLNFRTDHGSGTGMCISGAGGITTLRDDGATSYRICVKDGGGTLEHVYLRMCVRVFMLALLSLYRKLRSCSDHQLLMHARDSEPLMLRSL